jgi:hypothetical protein
MQNNMNDTDSAVLIQGSDVSNDGTEEKYGNGMDSNCMKICQLNPNSVGTALSLYMTLLKCPYRFSDK